MLFGLQKGCLFGGKKLTLCETRDYSRYSSKVKSLFYSLLR